MQDGKILRSEAYGVADMETGQPFTSDTIGWIASLTKPVTAAAAMTLVDEERLDLDAPVEKYMPAFRSQKGPDGAAHQAVPVRRLMSHSSGVQTSVPLRPGFFFEPGWYRQTIGAVADAVAETDLVFSPGERTQYSNAAPYVTGRIVELVSGRGFGDIVQERILTPLGMDDTGFAIPAEKIDRAAKVYRRQEDQLVVYCDFDPAWDVRMTMPDGGLFSTTADIARFAHSFLVDSSPILSREAVEAMLTEESDGYGLAWILDRPGQFSHWGSSGTRVWGDRDSRVVGVVFFQVQDQRYVDEVQGRFRTAVTEALSR